MKHILHLVILSSVLSACSPKIALPTDYFNNGKSVGILFYINPIGVYREGQQGILDVALTPGNKFIEPLNVVDKQLDLKTYVKDFLNSAYTDSDKSIKVISYDFFPAVLKKYKNAAYEQGKRYYTYDLSSYKDRGVEEMVVIEANYGILASYYGFIQTDIRSMSELKVKIVHLHDNSLIYSRKSRGLHPIPQGWKSPPEYKSLEVSIKAAMIKSLQDLKARFSK